jgi:hypothetical protein
MSRPLDPNPSKANLYRRKWRAKNPKPPSAKKLEMERVRALLGTQLGSKLGKKELYKARRREKSRWDAVYKAGHSKVFGDTLYDYADALFKRRQEQEDKQKRGASAQAEYQRRYRAKKKAELPEAVAVPRLLEHLPEELHSVLHNLLDAVRRCPKPEPKPLTPEPEPVPQKLTLLEQRQAVLKAKRSLVFDGILFDYEDALWQEANP